MIWKNTLRDERPEDEQKVMICVGGIYHVAIYKDHKNGFEINEYNGFIPIKEDDVIYWADLSRSSS